MGPVSSWDSRRHPRTWQTQHQGSFMYKLVHKLKNSKKFCKKWCLHRKQEWREIWEQLCNKNESILQELAAGNLNPTSISQYCRSRKHIHKNIQELHIYWKQWSKLNWDILADNMTKFFFNYAKERASRNCIRGCQADDGKWIDDQDKLELSVVEYF